MTDREEKRESAPGDDLDPLEGVLRAGFGPWSEGDEEAGRRVRSVIAALMGGCEVRLQGEEVPDSSSDSPGTAAEGDPERPTLRGRYEVLGQLGEGGLGVVLHGRDVGLGRDVAIKRLRERHLHDPEMIRRFVVEAQIGGQLQHPGVVPVYDVGLRSDDTPCIIMKLVRGRTLASLLRERDSVEDRLVHFVRIFERVCQTLAYAHSRGVIHRDLKPSNVMIGAFGEVQLMDWGFAKVLGDPETEGAAGAGTPESSDESSVTLRTESSECRSEAGSVMGTFAYMAPEQARGEVDALDERSDVFGLGAILGEILTGAPPYGSGSREELSEQAREARLEPCFERLAASSADPALVQIARRCLAPEPTGRFSDAKAVADEVESYLTTAEERARRSELEAVEARARAEEADARVQVERRARRLTLALATTVLLALVTVGGGYAWIEGQRIRARRNAVELVDVALAEVNLQRGEARGSAEPKRSLAAFEQALFVATRAEGMIADRAEHVDLRERMRLCITELERNRAAARAAVEQQAIDEAMLRRLESARARMADDWDWLAMEEDYDRAFREYGVDVEALEAEEAAARVGRSSISRELSDGIDRWLGARSQLGRDYAKLLRIADSVDAGAWRRELRRVFATGDREALWEFARRAPVAELSAEDAARLGVALSALDRPAAASFLAEALLVHPGDFWLNFDLGWICTMTQPRRAREAVGRLRAAVALRPESQAAWNNLGRGLMYDGRPKKAREAFLVALELAPGDPTVSCCYAELLRTQLDDYQEAKRILEASLDADGNFAGTHAALGDIWYAYGEVAEARSCWHRALELDPRRVDALGNLGVASMNEWDFVRARELLSEAVTIDSTNALNLYNLGVVLAQLGDGDGAMAEYEKALSHDPGLAEAHINLGIQLEARGETDGAEGHFRAALALPLAPTTRVIGLSCLGALLRDQGRLPESERRLNRLVELDPGNAEGWNSLGRTRRARGEAGQARDCFSRATELDPDHRQARLNLAEALVALGEFDKAIARCRELIDRDEHDVQAWINLGIARWNQGALDEALQAFDTVISLEASAGVLRLKGELLLETGDTDDGIAALERALALDDTDGLTHLHLSRAHLRRNEVEVAAASGRRALELLSEEETPEAHLALAAVADRMGRLLEVEEKLRLALVQVPNHYDATLLLGSVLRELGRRDEALAVYEELARRHGNHAEPFAHLALALRDVGRLYEALAALRRSRELGFEHPDESIDPDRLAADLELALALDASLPDTLVEPDSLDDLGHPAALARVCAARGLHVAAASVWESALGAESADLGGGAWFQAACAAARAAADSTGSPESERWRRRALEWLRRDFTILKERENDRRSVVRALRIRESHADLSGVRESTALASLPEPEEVAWRAYWQGVADLLLAAD